MIKIFKLKKFKKRRAETLVEVVVAMAVFGVMLGGICDFITNQTESVVRIKKQDEILFHKQQLNAKAQFLLAENAADILENNDVRTPSSYPNKNFKISGTDRNVEYVENNIVSFDWDHSEKLLVVFDDKARLSFDLN